MVVKMEGRNTQRLFTAAVVGGARDSEVIMKPENLQESFCLAEMRLIRFVHVEKHTDKDSETHTTQTHCDGVWLLPPVCCFGFSNAGMEGDSQLSSDWMLQAALLAVSSCTVRVYRLSETVSAESADFLLLVLPLRQIFSSGSCRSHQRAGIRVTWELTRITELWGHQRLCGKVCLYQLSFKKMQTRVLERCLSVFMLTVSLHFQCLCLAELQLWWRKSC